MTDDLDGFFRDVTHCIIDNDIIFSHAFVAKMRDRRVRCRKTCIRAPNMNTFMERFMLTFKTESLRWVIPRSEWHLRGVIKEFLAYYHAERNHQGLDEQIIAPGPKVGRTAGQITCRERLGGNLRYYYREAA
ncbi:MAG: integrase core domain-containing protein [Planctomycetota bacterium]